MSTPLDDTCPRCGTARTPEQEYCLECGLRLPPTTGRLARFRRGWVARVGWYPGDWFWTTMLALVVAAGGAAVAIATTRTASGGNTGSVFVATSPSVSLAEPTTSAPAPTVDTSTLPTPPEPPGTTTTAAPKPPPNGKTPWPAGETGWTVVLVSLPATKSGRDRAEAQAKRAVGGGLPEVGVLTSSRYSSLHPGYFVVFAGVYDSQGEAQSSLSAARDAGFSGAYVRQIAQ